MENIVFKTAGFKATTYVIGSERPKAKNKTMTARKNDPIFLETGDDVPLFFFCKDKLLGGAAISQKMALEEEAKRIVKTAMVASSLQPSNISIYIGPCLTFSHTSVSRETLLEVIAKGYNAAAKRTDGIDFLDVPLLVLLQMRELGIPMKNIFVSPYDPFENPDLLYSELSGDREKNLTCAVLQ
ncbi:MAG: laccase domain-containing protein [Bacilli bacterium]|nr:laccase domain-containing protein [Bacilli bacterium]